MSPFNIEPKHITEITLTDWSNLFFKYVLSQYVYQQVRCDAQQKPLYGYYDLKAFPIPNRWNRVVGIGIKREYFDQQTHKKLVHPMTTFCRLGSDEDWKLFQQECAGHYPAVKPEPI